MKRLTKQLSLIFLLSAPALANASSGIFPGETYFDNIGGSYQVVKVEQCQEMPLSLMEGLEAVTCRSQRAFRAGIEATQITLGICALAAPLPMQAKVAFGFASSVAIPVASFVLNHVPCDSTEDDKKVVTNICAMLSKQGVKCDQNKLTVKKETIP